MRKWWIPIVMVLVLVSWGATEEWGYSQGAALIVRPRGMCETFIDQTTPLGFRQDTATCQEILGEAVRPVIDYALEHELVSDESQDLGSLSSDSTRVMSKKMICGLLRHSVIC